jgi:hypothetical protein
MLWRGVFALQRTGADGQFFAPGLDVVALLLVAMLASALSCFGKTGVGRRAVNQSASRARCRILHRNGRILGNSAAAPGPPRRGISCARIQVLLRWSFAIAPVFVSSSRFTRWRWMSPSGFRKEFFPKTPQKPVRLRLTRRPRHRRHG